ncbi:hypothetical protein Q3G72_011562 [Acer saccharum]|nr:hypothetical protein Q3G72_011562 [Acer saccharum]
MERPKGKTRWRSDKVNNGRFPALVSGGEKEAQILSGIKDGGDVPDRSYLVTEIEPRSEISPRDLLDGLGEDPLGGVAVAGKYGPDGLLSDRNQRVGKSGWVRKSRSSEFGNSSAHELLLRGKRRRDAVESIDRHDGKVVRKQSQSIGDNGGDRFKNMGADESQKGSGDSVPNLQLVDKNSLGNVGVYIVTAGITESMVLTAAKEAFQVDILADRSLPVRRSQ